jgi:hypothetical protein
MDEREEGKCVLGVTKFSISDFLPFLVHLFSVFRVDAILPLPDIE